MTHLVTIADFAYDPPVLSVQAGDSVIWINRDSMQHSATRTDQPAFNTGLLARNQASAPQVFTEVSPPEGFQYFCIPHEDMIAHVIVTAEAPPCGGAGN